MLYCSSTSCVVCVVLLVACCVCVFAHPFFLHFSDAHLDLYYEQGTAVNCELYSALGLPCCHSDSIGSGTAGEFGEIQCDAPVPMLNAVLEAMHDMFPDPDFIIFTGDVAPHSDVSSFDSKIEKDWTALYDAFDLAFPASTVVLPVMGNHDTYPCDQYGAGSHRNLVKKTVEQWGRRLNDSAALELASENLFYSTVPPARPGLRVVVFNSNFYVTDNLFVSKHDEDPAGQKDWLTSTFREAASNGERVWVASHAAARRGSKNDFNSWYNDLMEELAAEGCAPVAQFFGHSHQDELSLSTPYYGADSVAWSRIVPSFSRYGDKYPTFRVVYYDEVTMMPIDELTYYVNVTRANEEGKVTLEQYYSTRELYNMTDLSAASWRKVAEQMLVDESTAVTYLSLSAANPDMDPGTCDQSCRTSLYCDIVYSVPEITSECESAAATVSHS